VTVHLISNLVPDPANEILRATIPVIPTGLHRRLRRGAAASLRLGA
jgi:hypothetical protein